jgi:hypothetical protein
MSRSMRLAPGSAMEGDESDPPTKDREVFFLNGVLLDLVTLCPSANVHDFQAQCLEALQEGE